MSITQSFLKKCFFLSAFILIFTASYCNEVDLGTIPTSPLVPGTPGIGVSGSVQECQFYRVQSLIMACYRDKGFFTESNSERKNTITHICVKQAFQAGLGATVQSPYIPGQNNNQSGFNAWFVWGNIKAGSPPQAPPTLIEQQYYHLLNAFKNSMDVNRFSSCLSVGQTYHSAHDLIVASEFLVQNGNITPETFVNCYQEQLELYKAQKACSAAPTTSHPQPHTTSSPGTI